MKITDERGERKVSYYTTIIVSPYFDDEGVIQKCLREALPDTRKLEMGFTALHESEDWRGERVYVGAFNYFNLSLFLTHLSKHDWQKDDDYPCRVLTCGEDGFKWEQYFVRKGNIEKVGGATFDTVDITKDEYDLDAFLGGYGI